MEQGPPSFNLVCIMSLRSEDVSAVLDYVAIRRIICVEKYLVCSYCDGYLVPANSIRTVLEESTGFLDEGTKELVVLVLNDFCVEAGRGRRVTESRDHVTVESPILQSYIGAGNEIPWRLSNILLRCV